ncbi:hypothetical protein BDV32DRAFT_160940 [Aspergillus pseudonomiae]|nr:hypothetical protein BDV32DRAFT_160940 [Aspergillus pseudonomiae]
MAYLLSVGIFGPGTDEPAHWGFVIHQTTQRTGELLHTRMIDENLNMFQFEHRAPHRLISQSAWGLCKIRVLDNTERLTVMSVLKKVPAPKGGNENCQNWVIHGFIDLEVDGLVPEGTAEAWGKRIGLASSKVKNDIGNAWISLNGR